MHLLEKKDSSPSEETPEGKHDIFKRIHKKNERQ
jgi:hypothetical protein